MNQRPIILIGGGGHCMSVIDAAESAGIHILGILDVPSMVGTKVLDYKIIGSDSEIETYINTADFVITVGAIRSANKRRELYDRVKSFGGTLGKVIASTARVSPHSTLGEGSVVLHHALVNAGAHVGENCIINSGAIVEHGCGIGAHVHLSTAAVINGDCTVGSGSFVGSRSVVYQGCNIAANCIIAASSIVRSHLGTCGMYAGNPAILKKCYEP